MLIFLRQNIVEYFKANIVAYFFMILIFIIGIVMGALAVKVLPDSQKNELTGYLYGYFQKLIQGSYYAVDSKVMFGTVFLNYIKIIGIIWLLGFTIIGIPFVIFIIFTRGFVIGFTVGFLINEYVFKGLMFALASVMPHNFFAIPAVITSGVLATTFSLMLLRRKTKINLISQSIAYTVLCFSMLIVTLVAAITEVYIAPVFMRWVAVWFISS